MGIFLCLFVLFVNDYCIRKQGALNLYAHGFSVFQMKMMMMTNVWLDESHVYLSLIPLVLIVQVLALLQLDDAQMPQLHVVYLRHKLVNIMAIVFD